MLVLVSLVLRLGWMDPVSREGTQSKILCYMRGRENWLHVILGSGERVARDQRETARHYQPSPTHGLEIRTTRIGYFKEVLNTAWAKSRSILAIYSTAIKSILCHEKTRDILFLERRREREKLNFDTLIFL